MLLANLGMLLTAFAWGSVIPIFNLMFERWDPYFLGAARYVLGAPVLLLAVALIERGHGLLRPLASRRMWLLGIPLGIFAPLYTLGVMHANPITAAIVGSTGPAVAALVAWSCFRQPFDRTMIPSIVLAFAGGVLSTLDLSREGSLFDVGGGEFLILIASACWAWYSLAAQRWYAGWSQLRISALTIVTGSTISALIYLTFAVGGAAQFPPAVPESALDIGLFAWITLAAVVAGLLFWNHAVRTLGIVVTSLFLNLAPVFTVLISTALGVPPTAMQLLGGGLVIAGVLQSQLRYLPLRRKAAVELSPSAISPTEKP